jgi:monoterpene epsilon-lactone hydrolase
MQTNILKEAGCPGSPIPARGSRRTRIASAVSAVTLRQIGKVLPPEQAWGLWLSRQIVARVMDFSGPSLTGTAVESVDTVLPDGRRVVGEWVRARGVQRTDAAIYFVHGSGYALCSPRTHRRLTSWLSTLTGLPVFSIDYRLAPRHRFPAAADDVCSGWNWLAGLGSLPPEQIVVAGDSAGGHLAVDLMLHDAGARRAAGLVMLSPLVDLTFTLAAARERLRPDPAMRAADAVRLVELYCGGEDPAHPRLALDVAGGPALPRTLIQAGGAEMLAADAHQLAADIEVAGGKCDLEVWPDQVHVFQALPRLTPQAAQAMHRVAGFIAESLGGRVIDMVAS